MKFKTIDQLELKNKTVFIRTDMNVPIRNGEITDTTRIKASLATIEYALQNGANVIVATHLGRPTEGIVNQKDDVTIIAKCLSEFLNQEVPVHNDLNIKPDFSKSKLIMLQNVRCNIGEKKNLAELGKKYASLCDIFVHDAFATAHRSEASTDSIGYHVSTVCAGLLMANELKALSNATQNPKQPVVAIVAGSKVSTKLTILEHLAKQVDCLIVGGGILNTFLLASGKSVGKSLVEEELISAANKIITQMAKHNKSVPLPKDVITATKLDKDAQVQTKNIEDIQDNDMILDIGDKFSNELDAIIQSAGTIIWNGPIGVFEFDQFANGTRKLAQSIAQSSAYSLAGGGDTIAALNKFNLFDKISYVSTAGGALLEYLEGRELPAIKLLTK